MRLINFCWGKDETKFLGNNFLGGFRLGYEPNTILITQSGGNHVDLKSLWQVPFFLIEFNLFEALVSLQFRYAMASTMTFEADSDVINENKIKNANTVKVNNGWSVGLSLVDGMVIFGYGKLNYWKNSYIKYDNTDLWDDYWYAGVQFISAGRKAIK